ncbi:vesicle-associated membrane protein VAMP7 [Acrasis kona]|uniref:Vesicle-associated membrane protein VAMP7 n=1 Tax=Acrasis kona TaxID=1008807 RepID=A0AAW2Z559_9EUKA
MPIVYAVIAEGNNIIACNPNPGKRDLREIVKLLLDHIPHQNHKKTVEHPPLNIHYHQYRPSKDLNFVVLAVTDMDFPFRVVYDKFFDNIIKEYSIIFKSDKSASSKVKSAKNLLKDRMEFWNKPENDSFNRASLKINNVKSKMLDNVDKIMHNTEKLDSISEKTSDLVDNSAEFRTKSTNLKKAMRCEGFKLWIILAVVILLVVFLGVWMGCGFPDFGRCRALTDQYATPTPTDIPV